MPNYSAGSGASELVLGLLHLDNQHLSSCFLLLLILEDASSLSLVFVSQSIACLHLHTLTCNE